MKKIIPFRMQQARESRGLSMAELADLIEVTRQAISQYETGKCEPSLGVLNEISRILKYPISFFYKPLPQKESADGIVFFRSNSTAKKKNLKAAKVKIDILDEVHSYLENYVDFPSLNFPRVHYENDDIFELENEKIEEYANLLRETWDLGDGPIENLVGQVQKNGGHVAKIRLRLQKIDAFSSWRDNKPFIFLNGDKDTNARIRFDIAHELGHLIMHADYYSVDDFEKKEIRDKMESEANRFAGAFLMPEKTFSKDVYSSSIDHFVQLKRKWKTSIGSMIYRCETLGLLSTNQIKYLKDQMTKRAYWRKEPLDDMIFSEQPFAYKQAIRLLLDEKILTPSQIVEDIGCNGEELEEYCFLEKGMLDTPRIDSKNVIVLKPRSL